MKITLICRPETDHFGTNQICFRLSGRTELYAYRPSVTGSDKFVTVDSDNVPIHTIATSDMIVGSFHWSILMQEIPSSWHMRALHRLAYEPPEVIDRVICRLSEEWERLLSRRAAPNFA